MTHFLDGKELKNLFWHHFGFALYKAIRNVLLGVQSCMSYKGIYLGEAEPVKMLS